MAIPQSPIGRHGSGLGPLTMMTLLAAILLMELVAWGSLQAGMGMKVGVGDLFWTLIAIVTLGCVVLGSIVRGAVKRRFGSASGSCSSGRSWWESGSAGS